MEGNLIHKDWTYVYLVLVGLHKQCQSHPQIRESILRCMLPLITRYVTPFPIVASLIIHQQRILIRTQQGHYLPTFQWSHKLQYYYYYSLIQPSLVASTCALRGGIPSTALIMVSCSTRCACLGFIRRAVCSACPSTKLKCNNNALTASRPLPLLGLVVAWLPRGPEWIVGGNWMDGRRG